MARAARMALPLLPLLPVELVPIPPEGETEFSTFLGNSWQGLYFCLFACEWSFSHLGQAKRSPLKFRPQQNWSSQSTRLNWLGLQIYRGANGVVGKLFESSWKRSKPALSHLSSWIISRRRLGSSLALTNRNFCIRKST